jgi:hypothetical protein
MLQPILVFPKNTVYGKYIIAKTLDLQVSPQFISEEDNETESENKILCTPKPKRLRKSNKRKVL